MRAKPGRSKGDCSRDNENGDEFLKHHFSCMFGLGLTHLISRRQRAVKDRQR
jgi:hypothetical protein